MDGKRPKERMVGVGSGNNPASREAGMKNLKPPFSKDNPEEARECGKKGQRIAYAKYKARQTLAQEIEDILKKKIPSRYEDVYQMAQELKNIKSPTNLHGMAASLFVELYSPDTKVSHPNRMKAYELLRDQIGENPETAVEQRSNMLLEFGNAMRTGLDKEDIEKDAEQGGHVDDVDTNIVQG